MDAEMQQKEGVASYNVDKPKVLQKLRLTFYVEVRYNISSMPSRIVDLKWNCVFHETMSLVPRFFRLKQVFSIFFCISEK